MGGTCVYTPHPSNELGKLVEDIWYIVFSYLEPPELVNCACLNSKFKDIITSSGPLWQSWKTIFPSIRRPAELSWLHSRNLRQLGSEPVKGNEILHDNVSADDSLDGDHVAINFSSLFNHNSSHQIIDFIGPNAGYQGAEVILCFEHPGENDDESDLWQACKADVSLPPSKWKEAVFQAPPERHRVRWREDVDVLMNEYLVWTEFCEFPLKVRCSENGWVTVMTGLEHGEDDWTDRRGLISAQPTLDGRAQQIRLLNIFTHSLHTIKFKDLLGDLPWQNPKVGFGGCRIGENVLIRIYDDNKIFQYAIQLSDGTCAWKFELDKLLLKSNSTLLLEYEIDHMFGYSTTRDNEAFLTVRSAYNGSLISDVGPLPLDENDGNDVKVQCHLSSLFAFFFKFARQNDAFSADLEVCFANARCSSVNIYDVRTGQFLYHLIPPLVRPTFKSPIFWYFSGWDPLEQYFIFLGSSFWIKDDCSYLLAWDMLGRQWTRFPYSLRDRPLEEVLVLYKEGGRSEKSRPRLKMALVKMDLGTNKVLTAKQEIRRMIDQEADKY